jgi:hypothetical protein
MGAARAGLEAPEAIESKARFDVQAFERDELRSVIRRAHYQDEPEQLGKTPPTATNGPTRPPSARAAWARRRPTSCRNCRSRSIAGSPIC